jgi:hypothetical protein
MLLDCNTTYSRRGLDRVVGALRGGNRVADHVVDSAYGVHDLHMLLVAILLWLVSSLHVLSQMVRLLRLSELILFGCHFKHRLLLQLEGNQALLARCC